MRDKHHLSPTTFYLPLEKFQKPGDGLTVQGRLQTPCVLSIAVNYTTKKEERRVPPRVKTRGLLRRIL
jgi:hypothetical protein